MHSSVRSKQRPTRDRVLAAAKELFSSGGYESTTTATIARQAETSESQLIKHFGGKEGILIAIFEQGWQRIAPQFIATSVIREPREKLRVAFELMIQALEGDPQLAELMLLEGRRVRRGRDDVLITDGYRRFVALIEQILKELCAENGIREVKPRVLASGLIGLFEGLLRDRMVQQRAKQPGWSVEEIKNLFQFCIPRLFGISNSVRT
jgi:AcrR family transcriptional regulator